MGAKKKQVPGFVYPPGPLAPIEDWDDRVISSSIT